MSIVDALLPEFDHEIATTRTLLARVPDGRNDWAPHPKASSLEKLAGHIAILPGWGEATLAHDSVDLATMPPPAPLTTREAWLGAFDATSAAMRAALVGRTDAELMATWSLKRDGQVIFSMPRVAVLRSFFMNHLIHHRGQLSVYLRALDVALPAIYGPSADEGAF